MIGKRFRSLPFIFANDNYTLSSPVRRGVVPAALLTELCCLASFATHSSENMQKEDRCFINDVHL